MFIDKNEVLRYLGHHKQRIDAAIDDLIEECINETINLANYKYVFKIFPIQRDVHSLKLLHSIISLNSSDILEHLRASTQCAVMAVTLGVGVEKKIQFYEKSNLTKALVMDACATTAVEWVCDQVEAEIKQEAQKKQLNITGRYSPGYGDFDIKIQPQLLQVLNAQKQIGLTCTEEAILIPRKSVTALIGLQELSDCSTKEHNCEKCNKFANCQYKKGGSRCGN